MPIWLWYMLVVVEGVALALTLAVRDVPRASGKNGIKGLKHDWPLMQALRNIMAWLLSTLLIATALTELTVPVAVVTVGGLYIAAQWLSARHIVIQAAEGLISKYASRIERYIQFCKPLLTLFIPGAAPADLPFFYSKEELLSATRTADFLTQKQKLAIEFNLKQNPPETIQNLMTPFSAAHPLVEDQALSPGLLDQLHKSGRDQFPVLNISKKKVVGILRLEDIMPLKTQAHNISDVMDRQVVTMLQADQPSDALAQFLQSRQHLFIVVNESKEPTGVISTQKILTYTVDREPTV